MSDMNSELLIKILTAYDNGGMAAAQSAMTSTTQKTEQQGAATEKTNSHWRAWTHTMHGAAQLAEGSIQGLGSALHGVSQLLGGMAGLGVGAIIGLGGAAIAGVISHWAEAKRKIEEAKQAAHDYSLAEQQAGQTENLKRELEEITAITTQWEAAVAASEKYREAQARMKSAELDSKLAQLDLEEARAKEGKTKEEQANIGAEYKVKRTAVTGEIGVAAAEQKHKDAQAKQEAFKQSQAAANFDQSKLDDAAAETARERREAEAKMQAAGIAPGMDPKRTEQAERDARERVEELRRKQVRTYGLHGEETTVRETPEERADKERQAAEIEAGLEAAQTLSAKQTREQTARTAAEAHRKATDGLFAPDAGRAEAQNVETTRKELQTAQLRANAGNLNAGQDYTNHQAEQARRAEAKRLQEEEADAKAQLQRDKQELEGVDRGVHQGNKGLANIDQGLHQAGSSGDPTAALAQLHEATKSSDIAVRRYAEESLRLHEGTLNDMAALTAKVAALEKRRKTQSDDIGGVAG